MVDTELLFGLNPRDRRHHITVARLRDLRGRRQNIFAPDTALLEFQNVLRGIGHKPEVIRVVILGLRKALEINGVEEAKTLDSSLLAKQSEIEERYGLTYFDSLIAASTLAVDGEVVSDDTAFEKVPGIKRTPVS